MKRVAILLASCFTAMMLTSCVFPSPSYSEWFIDLPNDYRMSGTGGGCCIVSELWFNERWGHLLWAKLPREECYTGSLVYSANARYVVIHEAIFFSEEEYSYFLKTGDGGTNKRYIEDTLLNKLYGPFEHLTEYETALDDLDVGMLGSWIPDNTNLRIPTNIEMFCDAEPFYYLKTENGRLSDREGEDTHQWYILNTDYDGVYGPFDTEGDFQSAIFTMGAKTPSNWVPTTPRPPGAQTYWEAARASNSQ